MKIKLTKDIPVEAKHGAREGRVFETLTEAECEKLGSGVWVRGDAGEPVRLMRWEWERVEEER